MSDNLMAGVMNARVDPTSALLLIVDKRVDTNQKGPAPLEVTVALNLES